jgi:hypothetical protein
MRVLFHPDFPKDIRKFEEEYRKVSEGLALRFRSEAKEAIEAVRKAPEGAGHYLKAGSEVVRGYRRRNLRSFPFFVLYGTTMDSIIFGSVIPSRSDPLTWLARFRAP